MIKPILTAAALSFAASTAAWALPVSQTTSLRTLNFSDLIQIGQKNKNKNKNHNHNHDHHNHNHNHDHDHHHGYYHGGRYWGHQYYVRPNNWQVLGCVAVGPVWYCP
jgi:ABC-type Zn2+ transport system substrate-binding protein/surface adhesin